MAYVLPKTFSQGVFLILVPARSLEETRMLKSLDTAKTGLLGQVTRNDLIANNLANAATDGFKREVARQTSEAPPGRAEARELTISSVTDFTKGFYQPTGNEMDVSIENDGFFVVENDGELLYTRSGSFRLDDTGRMVTQNGYVLQGGSGPITIDPEEGVPTIATDGSVRVGQTTAGTIRVVRFGDSAALLRAGANLFRAGEGQQPEDVEISDVQLLTGFKEGSNVNAVSEMVSMLTALRTYQAIEKSVQSADQILDVMINQVGRVRGSG
jgi:flagellar basal-body rod protein FlgG